MRHDSLLCIPLFRENALGFSVLVLYLGQGLRRGRARESALQGVRVQSENSTNLLWVVTFTTEDISDIKDIGGTQVLG